MANITQSKQVVKSPATLPPAEIARRLDKSKVAGHYRPFRLWFPASYGIGTSGARSIILSRQKAITRRAVTGIPMGEGQTVIFQKFPIIQNPWGRNAVVVCMGRAK